MAENESLDIDSRYGKRWKAVVHTALEGKSHGEVGRAFKKAFHAGLKRSIAQLANCGVTIDSFIEARNCPTKCKELLRQCQGHPYARQLVNVIHANSDATDAGVIKHWLNGCREKLEDQIGAAVLGSDHYPSMFETAKLFDSVEIQIDRDLDNVAEKLVLDAEHVPNALPDRASERSDPTELLLGMSLLAGANK